MKTSNSLKLIRECPLNGSERRLLDPHFKEEERKDWLLIRKVIQPASERGHVKIPHSSMTKRCWETLVTCL